MKYCKDFEIKELKNRKDLDACLDYISNDIWLKPYINECSLSAIPENSLVRLGMMEDIQVTGANNTMVSVKNVDDEDIFQCAKENGLLLIFPMENKWAAIPARYTAFSSICDRAGLSGRTITNNDEKTALSVLPIMEKAQWLSRGFSLNKLSCKILLRDGKISAMLSNKYNIMPVNEILPLFEKEIKKEHPNLVFKSGKFSHEYMFLDYLLEDPILEDSFLNILQTCGMANIAAVKAGIRFSTSDIGYSMVRAIPNYEINGFKIRLGKPIEVKHDNGKEDDFLKLLKTVGMLFKEAEDRVEELGNINISYPSGCLQHIFMKENKNIPKQIVDIEIEKLCQNPPAHYSAINLYITLNEMVEETAQKKALSPKAYLNMSEEIARLLYLDYEKYDKPFIEKEI